MTTKTFVDYSTPVIDAAWLNDVDATVYQALGLANVPPTTGAQVISNLGLLTASVAASTYLTQASATATYLTIANAASTYAPIAQTMYIGTTAVAINRASAALVLTGITSIDGNAATATAVTTTIQSAVVGTTQAIGDNSTKIATTAYADRKPVLGTAQATTSGTSITFLSIPAWAKVIQINLVGVSTNGTSVKLIQVGSGSVTTSGYLSSSTSIIGATAASAAATAGFGINSATAAQVLHGTVTLTLENATSNTWVASGVLCSSDAASTFYTAGRIALAGALDRVVLTTTNGTDAFDAGEVNIQYD